MAKNKSATAEATANFFSKQTPPGPNNNNDLSTKQQIDRLAIKNWTCSGHKGGPINLNAVANASNIIQAHVCAAGNGCGDTILPLVSRHRCSGCGFAVHIICQVKFELNGLSLPYPSFTGICKPCATQLDLVKLVTRDDCDHPFLSFKSPRVHQISKNRWKSLQIQPSKEAIAKKKREAQARKSNNSTASTNSPNNTPPPATTAGTLATPANSTNVIDKTIIDLDNDDDSNSEATTKETNNASVSNPKRAARVKDFSAEKVSMDLKSKMPPHEDLMEAMDLAIERSKQWYLDMLRIKPSLKLHTVDPDNDTITPLDDPAKFPTTLPDAKEFFHGLRPNLGGGYTNVKVLASCKQEMKKMAK
jgi:hypothetical protein